MSGESDPDKQRRNLILLANIVGDAFGQVIPPLD